MKFNYNHFGTEHTQPYWMFKFSSKEAKTVSEKMKNNIHFQSFLLLVEIKITPMYVILNKQCKFYYQDQRVKHPVRSPVEKYLAIPLLMYSFYMIKMIKRADIVLHCNLYTQPIFLNTFLYHTHLILIRPLLTEFYNNSLADAQFIIIFFSIPVRRSDAK